jgi:uncharacterized delta-60 repeat protein
MDGKVLVGGAFSTYNGTARRGVVRLNPNGTLDTSFNPGGTGTNDDVEAIVVQSDGKVLIGGQFTSYNGTGRGRIARLNTDGTLDGTFNPGSGGAAGGVSEIVMQSDGKVVIAGLFEGWNGALRRGIARLNSNGTLDTSFNTGTGAYPVYTVAMQSDGKVIIAGDFTSYNGIARNKIARLNADGTLDASFDPGAGPTGYPEFMVVQSNGKIVVGGSFVSFNSTWPDGIARLNADGTLDPTFDPGSGARFYVRSVALQSDGKILIGGSFTSYNGAPRKHIARLAWRRVGDTPR